VQNVLTVTFPFFALVLLGYGATQRGMLALQAIAGLNGFVLFFALPCMLFRFGVSMPVAQWFDVRAMLVYGICALTMVALVVAATRRGRIGWNDAAFGALVGAFPNTGFMGVPLLVALLGPKAAGPAILVVLLDMVLTSSVCIALSRLDGAAASAAQSLNNACKGVVANPLLWSILLGAAVSVSELQLPKPMAQTVALLADAASPVALFTIGAVLARSQMMARCGHARAVHWHAYVPVAAAKLLLHPLLVFLVGSLSRLAGLGLDRFTLTALVLLAALPSASNVSMLAERYGADNGRIAHIILASTAAAFFTFSGAVTLMTGP
jgi:predicted permease